MKNKSLRLNLMQRASTIFPAFRLHVWGGLGSQIYALVVAHRLGDLMKPRRISIVFHTGGVTQRFIEIPKEALLPFNVLQVHDFQSKGSERQERQSASIYQFKLLLKKLLKASGLMSDLNSQKAFLNLRPWNVSCRGHYSELVLSEKDFELVASSLSLDRKKDIRDEVCIHFRLGDLLFLNNKSFVPHSRWFGLFSHQPKKPITIFSDSEPKEVLNVLGSALNSSEPRYQNWDSIPTIQYCLHSKVFIGTNSKISIWIALLRSFFIRDVESYLPAELKNRVEINMMDLQTSSPVYFY